MKESGTYIMLSDMAKMQGKTVSQISRETGMSRNTVRKYLRQGYQPHQLNGRHRPSKLDPYKTHLDNLMKSGIYNCSVLKEHLEALGYRGGMTILKDYVQKIRPPMVKAGPAIRRYETKPGRQAQMDWGTLKYWDTEGLLHKVYVFVMILGHSRMRYIEFSRRSDVRSLLRCMTNGFIYYDGIPETVLTDRMKTVMLSVDHGKAVWQEAFELYANEMGFLPKVCRSRRPQTKGKVERLVHFVRDNFMAGRQFTDFGDLQNQAIDWCDKVNLRVHSTTGEAPRKLLATEKLKPLPVSGEYYKYLREPRKVARDCFVAFNGARYGVNWQHAGETVQVMQTLKEVLITNSSGELLAEHPVCHKTGKYVYVKDQYAGLVEQEGKAYVPAYGQLIAMDDVEIRPLTVYAALAGGDY